MKVFISHKKEDSAIATEIYKAFSNHGISSYLDVMDSSISGGGKELTDHIKKNLNSCTDIIVVMSESTKLSWWVPFEVGMSAQVNMPTVSFLKSEVSLPSYLSYWPRLRTISDIDKYITTRKKTAETYAYLYENYNYTNTKARETQAFYDALKSELR